MDLQRQIISDLRSDLPDERERRIDRRWQAGGVGMAEGDETVVLTGSAPSAPGLSAGTATVTITDADAMPTGVTLSFPIAIVTEGAGTVEANTVFPTLATPRRPGQSTGLFFPLPRLVSHPRTAHPPEAQRRRQVPQLRLRRSQRCALARLHSPGGRACSAAAVCITANNAARKGSSNSSNEPLNHAPKQSGKQLTVRPSGRQMKRRIQAPRGCTRG